jgi:DNA-binding cell septation regulator SpoVG
MNHKITEIQILPVKPQNGIVAFASFLLDSNLYLSSIAIMTRPQSGYRLVYPTKKTGNRDINIFHPINRAFAEFVEEAVMKKFEEVMKFNDRYDCVNIRA